MPFYFSPWVIGILVNTPRYTMFYMVSEGKLDEWVLNDLLSREEQKIALNTVELYGKKYTLSNEIKMRVEGTEGVVLYVFAGPWIKDFVQQYTLFSGGLGLCVYGKPTDLFQLLKTTIFTVIKKGLTHLTAASLGMEKKT